MATIYPGIPSASPMSALSNSITIQELSPLKRSGLLLSRMVLFLIGGYLIFMAIVVVINTSKNPRTLSIDELMKVPISDTLAFSKRLDLVRIYHEQAKDSQGFFKDMSQMVLLNLLLPVLTALLGYIFGTREETKQDGDSS